MEIKIFEVPTFDSTGANIELNKFLRNHKILNIEQQLVQNGNMSYWTFVVRYHGEEQISVRENKKDFMTVLGRDIFERFSILREIRKQIAANEQVKTFMVFTDKELAEIAKMPELIPEKMIAIKGIGDKKIERFGYKLVQMFNNKLQNETSEPPF